MSPPVRSVAVALAALLVLQAGVAVGLPSHPAQIDGESVEPENTTMLIELRPNGDARWTISMNVPLETQEDVESFRTVGTEFENGDSEYLPISTFRRFVDLSSQATGRQMGIGDNISRSATVQDDTGRLSLGFTWTNFGNRDGEELTVGDAFESPDGTWLEGLTAKQRLVIEAPDTFEITSAPKGFTNKTIQWTGPREFSPSYLAVTYSVESSRTTMPPTTGSTTRSGSPTTTISPVNSNGLPLLPVAIVGLVAAGIAGLYLSRYGLSVPEPDGVPSDGSTSENSDEGGEPIQTERNENSGATAAGTADLEPDQELLSDEEYVEALIERNGGRMKQADIVTETEWSNAKVSQLLSAMAEDGRVEKLRIGRENLISFPEEGSDDLE